MGKGEGEKGFVVPSTSIGLPFCQAIRAPLIWIYARVLYYFLDIKFQDILIWRDRHYPHCKFVLSSAIAEADARNKHSTALN
ncbi:MAG: hypothetical protein VKK42_30430 [Lyngbya sp.]|nr:hypothetical protein [Lyngbya sp.]